MTTPCPCTVDFETFKIEGRPDYPPAPVGVAIKYPGEPSRYYAWGHPTNNNCTKEQADAALRKAYLHSGGLLFHNAKFDLDVAEVHCGLGLPDWRMVHETMFLVFLDDPNQREVGLKPSAHRILGLAPDERDAVAEWLIARQPVPGVRITHKSAGAYIAYAPGDLVGEYACGDVDRTAGLFARLYPSIEERGMLEAYDRERRLIPILLDMERRGVRVDLPRLRSDVENYSACCARLEQWVRRRLAVSDEVNLDSGEQLVEALVAAGLADVSKMGVTPKAGKVKTDKAALANGVTDPQLAAVLRYTAQLKTCLGTFMRPWLEVAERSGGYIYTNWNQIRGGEGGTRTGRFSSTPNFQNIPKEFDPIFEGVAPPFPLPDLPLCRGYVVPYAPGHVLVGRDYSQQEPRILAHFEDGELQAQYQADPWVDFHDNAKENLERIYKKPYRRKSVKIVNLGLIYGQGVASLAAASGESVESTQQLSAAILNMYPGLKTLRWEMKQRASTGSPIRTWGGREYYCEPPEMSTKYRRMMTYGYKMVNTLVQGSAADCTKEGMIRFAEVVERMHKRGWLMLLQVHDEIVVSVPREDLEEAQWALRDAMESVEFDVKILSEGAWSDENWASMKNFDVKGKVCGLG